VVATAEMHATKAMTTAEMSTAVATSAVSTTTVTTAAVTAFRQRCTRQQGRDNQNGNFNAELRHVIYSGGSPTQNDAGRNRKFLAPKAAQEPD
jgi:hypothetical protein